eukprot:CAMPEP_0197390054 /NCGR_PEP_ID=MMETSP1165-20131217/2137_1 /TAXON_ID=284809 /ORGANISM="Chrysocystis fragilis, Strain CCMP3189" /LENGTH=419 /DNA_ID=CAMNT_0042915515 /DNA_START=172 /DNA_END=1431 /DNA_ORIENTATION=-
MCVVLGMGAATWEEVASIPVALSDMSATAIGVTTVLVVGGCDSDQLSCSEYTGCSYCPSITARAVEYSTNDDRWRELAWAPRARYRHAAAYDGSSTVYVVGGRDLEDSLISAIDAYSIAANEWTTLDAASHESSDLGAFVSGGVLYAYGGYDASYTALSGATAITLADETTGEAPAMLEARGDFGLVVDAGVAYVAGGWSHLDWCAPLASVEALDLETMTWRSLASMSVARGDKALALVDASLVVAGGEHNNGCTTASTPVDDVELYDGERWTAVADVPEPKFRAAAVGLDSAVFVFGGQAARTTEECPVDYCFPVTAHTWKFVLPGDSEDTDDDGNKGKKRKHALVVLLVVLLLVLCCVALASCVLLARRRNQRFQFVTNSSAAQGELMLGPIGDEKKTDVVHNKATTFHLSEGLDDV